MDNLSKQILKEAFGEPVVIPKPRRDPAEQPGQMDHWSRAILMERAAYLKKLAKYGDGTSSEALREYSQHAAVLLVRGRSGEAEVHAQFADVFVVLDGLAMLVTGGAITNSKQTALGEYRGDSIEGGKQQELRAGDIAHVPAGVPHQMLVAGEKTVTCFVMKIQEKD